MRTPHGYLMLLLLGVALGIFGWVMTRRIRVMLAGRPEDRFDRIGERIGLVLKFALGQNKMFRHPRYGVMHALIFWGFLVLLLRSIVLGIMAFSKDFALPGAFGAFYTATKDIVEVIVLCMVSYGLYRRLFRPPPRITASWEGTLILGFIATLMITDLFFDAARFAQGRAAEEAQWALVGSQLAALLRGVGPTGQRVVEEATYWTHMTVLLTFLNLLPLGKHFHVITAIPNVFFGRLDSPGKLSDLDIDDEEAERFGTGRAEDLTWKQILDTYTCTECGRCTVNCPAWNTDKPLSPKFLINDIRHHVMEQEARLLGKVSEEELSPWTQDGESKLILSVNEDVLWSCTTCRSCEENCPVLITHVDKIVDMRRYLVLTEEKFPRELQMTFRSLEQKGNPWGLPAADREAWMEHPSLEGIEIPHISEAKDAEYLVWVGCAGAYDDRQKKVTRALIRLLHTAGVRFAVLGGDETCTGDPARRAGAEHIFQALAEANIEVLNEFGVRKIVTHCPHCLNTLLNEYPAFGGHYEVIHHSELLARLVAEGRLRPRQARQARITFHDSCYLGRYNDIYDEPRAALQAIEGVSLVEMRRSRRDGMCCGAGGARFFMEEKLGTRVNHLRVEQAMKTKPDVVASACPFCLRMLRDGLADKGLDESVDALDIAELLDEAVHGGQTATTPAGDGGEQAPAA